MPYRVLSRLVLLVPLLGLLGSCQNKIVEQSYGTLGKESINGLDAMTALIKDRARDVFRSSYISRRVREEADLLIFFEKHPGRYPPQFFPKFESWLTGRELPEEYRPEDSKENFKEKHEEELEEPSQSVEARPPRSSGRWLSDRILSLIEVGQRSDLVGHPESKGRAIRARRQEPVLSPVAPKGKAQKRDHSKKTLLYFVRDTTSDVPFFERVYHDLRRAPRYRNYIKLFLDESRRMRMAGLPGVDLPFGTRTLSREGGPLVFQKDLLWDSDLFSRGVAFVPVRYISDAPSLRFISGGRLAYRTLLKTRRNESLIREFSFPEIRLIMIYNTEPFLNYSLVRRPYLDLAGALLRYAMPLPQGSTVAIIERAPIPPVQAHDQRDEGLSRIFFVYPANLLVFCLLVFLAAFLWSRWPHERRPLPTPRMGNRVFLEHFVALGKRLERSKDRTEVLERLLAFKEGRTKIGSDKHTDPHRDSNAASSE